MTNAKEQFAWLAPMVLWPILEPQVPASKLRPQGGGTQRIQDEATFAAIAFVLTSGCVWRDLPAVFGVSWQTAHRRFTHWGAAGTWALLAQLGHEAGQDNAVRTWATRMAEAAAQRQSDAKSSYHDSTRPNTAPPARQRPRIKRRLSGGFADRLFGPREGLIVNLHPIHRV